MTASSCPVLDHITFLHRSIYTVTVTDQLRVLVPGCSRGSPGLSRGCCHPITIRVSATTRWAPPPPGPRPSPTTSRTKRERQTESVCERESPRDQTVAKPDVYYHGVALSTLLSHPLSRTTLARLDNTSLRNNHKSPPAGGPVSTPSDLLPAGNTNSPYRIALLHYKILSENIIFPVFSWVPAYRVSAARKMPDCPGLRTPLVEEIEHFIQRGLWKNFKAHKLPQHLNKLSGGVGGGSTRHSHSFVLPPPAIQPSSSPRFTKKGTFLDFSPGWLRNIFNSSPEVSHTLSLKHTSSSSPDFFPTYNLINTAKEIKNTILQFFSCPE
ncbi:hypothetical protein J6590_044994 [Homalodisca vitripennis]|nr:hypothetical protein J6590_044994 [Homalodisca vitripennis]